MPAIKEKLIVLEKVIEESFQTRKTLRYCKNPLLGKPNKLAKVIFIMM